MSRWHAIFNNGSQLASAVTLLTTRAFATVDATAAAVPANQPVFSRSRLYASSPRASDVITLDATGLFQRFACGEWSDGQHCVLHQRGTLGGAVRHVNIHVGPAIAANSLATNPARSVMTFGTAGRKTGIEDLLIGAGPSQGEDNDWTYVPTAYQVLPGCPVVVCQASQWNGSVFTPSAVAICWWDESLSGSNKWRLYYRGPTAQVGRPRGAPWQMPQAWDLGVPNQLFVTFSDYRQNPQADGGQAFIVGFTRTGEGAPYTPQGVLPAFVDDRGYSGTHTHGMFLFRFGAAGMGFAPVGGDSAQSLMPAVVRDDMNYLQGENGTFVARMPTDPTVEEVDLGRGWRMYPHAGGNHLNIVGGTAFSAGTWDNTAKTLTATALNTASVGNRVGYWIVVTAGTGITTPIYDRVSVHSGTTVTLPNLNVANASNWSGFVCPIQQCHQPVAMHQMPDGTVYLGGDEAITAGTIVEVPTFRPGDRAFRFRAVGDSSTAHSPSEECNQFQAVCNARDRSRFYVGKYESSSFNSDASGRVQVSDGKAGAFATVASPNADLMPALGMHGVVGVSSASGPVSWLLYTTGTSTFAVRAPDYVQRVRPLISASPAYTNHLINTLGANVGALGGDGSPNAAWSELVNRENLPTLLPGHVIPPPPSNGPIFRIQNRGEYGFGRPVTGATLANNQRIRISGWWYNMPQSTPNGDTVAGGYDNASASPFITTAPSGGNAFTQRSADLNFPRFDGYGWQPFTISLGRPTTEWIGSQVATIAATFAMNMIVRSESGSRWLMWQSLMCLDSVVQGDTGEVPVISPPSAATSQAVPEASTRLNVPVSGAAWSCVVRGSIPRNGGDEYMPNRNASRALFTLSNGTTFLRVVADPANDRISVTDGTNTVHCAARAGQVMHFDRGGQISIGLALTGTTLTVVASVDGTIINSASGTVAATTYDRVLSGDQNNTNAEPMEWWSLEGFATALSASALGDVMRAAPQVIAVPGPFDTGRTRAR